MSWLDRIWKNVRYSFDWVEYRSDLIPLKAAYEKLDERLSGSLSGVVAEKKSGRIEKDSGGIKKDQKTVSAEIDSITELYQELTAGNYTTGKPAAAELQEALTNLISTAQDYYLGYRDEDFYNKLGQLTDQRLVEIKKLSYNIDETGLKEDLWIEKGQDFLRDFDVITRARSVLMQLSRDAEYEYQDPESTEGFGGLLEEKPVNDSTPYNNLRNKLFSIQDALGDFFLQAKDFETTKWAPRTWPGDNVDRARPGDKPGSEPSR